jgi:hypothetical protein
LTGWAGDFDDLEEEDVAVVEVVCSDLLCGELSTIQFDIMSLFYYFFAH